MLPLMPVLTSLLLSVAIVLAVDLVTTYLRRKAGRTTHASTPEPTERRANGSTD